LKPGFADPVCARVGYLKGTGVIENTLQLAQVNIARLNAPLDSPSLANFVARQDELNALADRSPGFVWRLQDDEGYVRPYEDPRILFNLSVWESVESLRTYVYSSAHVEVVRRRREWFSKLDRVHAALWWVPKGHRPSIDEATERLAHLDQHGPTPHAFSFRATFDPGGRSHPHEVPSDHAGLR
jgi:hypothetical protein